MKTLDGVGENRLGKILMKIREEIKATNSEEELEQMMSI